MSSYRPYWNNSYDRGNGMFPPAIKWLLISNAALFILPQVFHLNLDFFHRMFGLVPFMIWDRFFLWQLVTYMFIHGGVWHILMNMFILWMFGRELEQTWGTREFTKFYFIAGIGAGLINVLVATVIRSMWYIPIVGASGAIYGILVAYAMLFPERYVYVYFMIPVKVKYLVIFLVALEFFSGLQADGVAHFAHLGGALVGFIYLKYEWRWKTNRWSPGNLLRKVKAEAMAKKHAEGMRLMDEVDAILDKINQVGYDNLTRREKKILEKASDRLSKHGQE
jgi:membrane associated rhomboid family serine protease